jgi:chemotaxis protein methyltransferase CheR
MRVWSAGCGAGEEAYSLAIGARQRGIPIRILGTDWDEHQLARAREARYSPGCLKELPAEWRISAFEYVQGQFVLRRELRVSLELLHQDIRKDMPAGPFHLILCRYLAFTYFDPQLQHAIAEGLLRRIAPNGYVAIGKHESWPTDVPGLAEVRPGLRIYQKL